MVNSRAGGQGWTRIGKYEATGTDATETFTFSAVDFSAHSKIVIVIDGEATATFNMLLTINGLTANYYVEGRRLSAGAEVIYAVGTSASAQVISATVMGATGFNGEINIYLSKAGNKFPTGTCSFTGEGPAHEFSMFLLATGVTSITTITLATSTSTWIAGTRISIYKVDR